MNALKPNDAVEILIFSPNFNYKNTLFYIYLRFK